MRTRLIIPPTEMPVTLADVKTFQRVEGTELDAEISSYIVAAYQQCEHILGRSIMPETWELVLDAFPTTTDIELLHPIIRSITSVKYLNPEDGLETTLPDTEYYLDKVSEPGWLMPAIGKAWPSTQAVANAVRVQYVAGYENAAAVPDSIKNWIKLAVRALMDGCDPAGIDVQMAKFSSFLDRYRLWRI